MLPETASNEQTDQPRRVAETIVGVFPRSSVPAEPESVMQNLDDERRSRRGVSS